MKPHAGRERHSRLGREEQQDDPQPATSEADEAAAAATQKGKLSVAGNSKAVSAKKQKTRATKHCK